VSLPKLDVLQTPPCIARVELWHSLPVHLSGEHELANGLSCLLFEGTQRVSACWSESQGGCAFDHPITFPKPTIHSS
jgi:hypothetical protein